MSSMSKLMCIVAAAAMMFSTATLATAGIGPCGYPLKPVPCNADINESGAVDIDDLLLVVANWGDQSNEERPFGDIAPMDNGDCVVDINDLLMVLEHFGSDTSGCGPCGIGEIQDCLGNCVDAAWIGDGYCDDGSYSYNGNDIYLNCSEFDCDGGDCAPDNCSGGVILGACWLARNTCSVLEEGPCTDAGGLGWVAGADCTDTDSDRIPDAFERNDCSAPSNGFTGTDPLNADTDGDSLKDGDEIYGTPDGLDLRSLGCDACRKDILIEADWLYGPGQPVDDKKLDSEQVARIVAAFDAAPNTNPNGVTGIKMHIDIGQEPYGGGNAVADPNNDLILALGGGSAPFDGGEFPGIKTDNLAANRHGYFHYLVMCKQFSVNGTPSSSTGKAELPGDDFCVSFSSLNGDDDKIGNLVMHELGHNLDLRHGGDENRNHKANYNSVMNYNYAFCGVDDDGDIDPDGVLDYSRGTNIDLNENDLNEAMGVTGSGPAIDWNQNGDSTQTGIIRNVNCVWYSFSCSWNFDTNPCGSAAGCEDSSCDVLTDNNDWQAASFAGIIDTRGPKESVECMLQPE